MLFNWKLFPGTNLQDLNLDWIINFVKMIPSRLPKFSDHHTWLVYDYSTGEYYDSGEPTGGAGEPGEPGKSPIIGINGNWYVWNNDAQGYVDTGTKAQGEQGNPGAGVALGGVAGDVLVKRSASDYDTGWTATPPQMGAIAHINNGDTADKAYVRDENLVYKGQLYKAVNNIASGETLLTGVNIIQSSVDDVKIGDSAAQYLTITDLLPYTTPAAGFVAYQSATSDAPVGTATFGGFTFYLTNVPGSAVITLVPKGAVIDGVRNVDTAYFVKLI